MRATECPLCHGRISEEQGEILWRAYHERGAAAAALAARGFERVGEVSEREVRVHFTAHQPQMAEIERGDAALWQQKIKGMRERKRRILALSWRFSPLTSELVREMFFSHQSQRAAEKNAMLRLRELTAESLLFRAYPDQLPGAILSQTPEPPLYLCSPMSGALIRERYGRAPQRDEVWRSARDLPDRARLLRWKAESDVLRALWSSVGERSGEGERKLVLSSGAVIRLSAERVFGRKLSEFRFADPLGLADRVRPAGLFWVEREDQSGAGAVPVFFYRDHPSLSAEAVQRELLAHQALARSGALASRFPTAKGAASAALVVIACDSSQRVQSLAELRRPPGSLAIAALAIEARYLPSSSVWERALWQPLLTDTQASRVSLGELLGALAPQFPAPEKLPWSWRGASFPQAEWLQSEAVRESRTAGFHLSRQSGRDPQARARADARRTEEQRRAEARLAAESEDSI